MTIKIIPHKTTNLTYNLYDVTFFDATVTTTVTADSSAVDKWISETEQHLIQNLQNLLALQPVVIELDVEWRPNRTRGDDNPVAVIQLCAGNRCLVFQILHSPIIPYSLVNFLASPFYVFAGVGIGEDVGKLMKDYYLVVVRTVDLRTLAWSVYRKKELKSSGLKKLASVVLRKQISKPKKVTMSCWDNWWLVPAQVQYACVDAYLSFEIGRILISSSQS
ncbi:3'-5' exonuclease-like [Bidens hawaiensis]|uniref:3'-5' exonuclease-like n=1 Tax=Bidens hawaiensis TaxID=980011 RepID=UPI004049BB69